MAACISRSKSGGPPASVRPRLVRDSAGAWDLIGFVSRPRDGFAGELSDPLPFRCTLVGILEVG